MLVADLPSASGQSSQPSQSSSAMPDSSDDVNSNISDNLEPAPSRLEDGVMPPRRQFSAEVADDGDQYFVDILTQETTWAVPDNGEIVQV